MSQALERALAALQEKASLVVREEGGRGRLYRVPGHSSPLPSVTTVTRLIAKEALPNWYRRMALEGIVNSLPRHSQT